MESLNFEADVLEIQAKLEKVLMIFVICISKLTETARSGEEVRGAYSDHLLVSQIGTRRRGGYGPTQPAHIAKKKVV